MAEVYYFGCNERSGHYLHRAGHWRTLDHYEAKKMRVPSDHALDGGAIFLPHPEKLGYGALTYLPANDLTVLAWWGSPWDQRGAVNTAVMVRGRYDNVLDLWREFTQAFPKIANQLAMPIIEENATSNPTDSRAKP